MNNPAVIRQKEPEGNSHCKRKERLYPYGETHDHSYRLATELLVR